MCSKENTEVPGGGKSGKWAVIIHTYIIYAVFPFMAILVLLDHKVKALQSSEMSGNIHTSTQCHIPEDFSHQQH